MSPGLPKYSGGAFAPGNLAWGTAQKGSDDPVPVCGHRLSVAPKQSPNNLAGGEVKPMIPTTTPPRSLRRLGSGTGRLASADSPRAAKCQLLEVVVGARRSGADRRTGVRFRQHRTASPPPPLPPPAPQQRRGQHRQQDRGGVEAVPGRRGGGRKRVEAGARLPPETQPAQVLGGSFPGNGRDCRWRGCR